MQPLIYVIRAYSLMTMLCNSNLKRYILKYYFKYHNSDPWKQLKSTRFRVLVVWSFFIFHWFLKYLVFKGCIFFIKIIDLILVESLWIKQHRLSGFFHFVDPKFNKHNLIWVKVSSLEHLSLFDSAFVLGSFISVDILIKVLYLRNGGKI
jgi:hypothetical protein